MTSIWKGLPLFAWMFSHLMHLFEDGTFTLPNETFFLIFGGVLDFFCPLVPFPIFVALIHIVYKFWTESCKKKVGNEEHYDWKKISQNFNLLCIGGTLYVLILLFPIPSNKKLGRDSDGILRFYIDETILYCDYIKDNTQKDFAQAFNKPPSQTGQASMWNSVYEALLQTACETQATWGMGDMGNIKYFMMAFFFALSLFNATTSYFMIAIYAIMIFLWFVSQDDEKMWMWTMPKDDITFMHIMAVLLSFFSAVCYNNKHFGKGVLHNWLLYVIAVYQLVSPTLWECDCFVLILFVVFPILQIYARKCFDSYDDDSRYSYYGIRGILYLMAILVYFYYFHSISAEQEKKERETWKYYFQTKVFAVDPWFDLLNTFTTRLAGFQFNTLLPRIGNPVIGIWESFGRNGDVALTSVITTLSSFLWGSSIAFNGIVFWALAAGWTGYLLIVGICFVLALIFWYNRDAIRNKSGRFFDACLNCCDQVKSWMGLPNMVFNLVSNEQQMAHLLMREKIQWTDQEWQKFTQMSQQDQNKHLKDILQTRLQRDADLSSASASSLQNAVEMLEVSTGFCMDGFRTAFMKQVNSGQHPTAKDTRRTPARAGAASRTPVRGRSPARGRAPAAAAAAPAAPGAPAPAQQFDLKPWKVWTVDQNTNARTPISKFNGPALNQTLSVSDASYKNTQGKTTEMEVVVYEKGTQHKAGHNFTSQGNKGDIWANNVVQPWSLNNKIWSTTYDPNTSKMTITMPDGVQTFTTILSHIKQRMK